MDSSLELPATDGDHATETPVIEFPDDDLDAVVHPFDAAERVLAAAP